MCWLKETTPLIALDSLLCKSILVLIFYYYYYYRHVPTIHFFLSCMENCISHCDAGYSSGVHDKYVVLWRAALCVFIIKYLL